MAILLAGGAGFIGSHMAVELLAQNYDIIVADNFSNSTPEALNRVKKLTGRTFNFYELDICDDTNLDKIFTKHRIECIIHFAGYKAAGDSVSMPLDYYSNNLNTTISLCKAMKRHGVKRLIFSSSACVYSEKNIMPITEGSIIGDCPNPYGWTKLMSEQILRDATVANPDWSIAMLRYFNLIGAHESGDIGDDPTGIPKNLPPHIAQTAAGKHKYTSIFGDDYPTPDGTCIRDYIHITDLVKGHVAAMKYCEKHTGAEAFNLGTGKGTSNFELLAAFEKANNIKIPISITARRSGDAPVSYCSTEKAEKLLNWKAVKTVEDGCRDMWHWQSKNPNGYKEA
ncbi:MAG: UDP-glucose 4-epimerase GalE [Defluviitaleaceae bacterium]|nr:UDP-glucose 4-epimerase GalE [Defluviitaleaceae bacterium]